MVHTIPPFFFSVSLFLCVENHPPFFSVPLSLCVENHPLFPSLYLCSSVLKNHCFFPLFANALAFFRKPQRLKNFNQNCF